MTLSWNEMGGGGSFVFSHATEGAFLQQTQADTSLYALESQPKASVSQKQIAGPAKTAGVATIQKCIGTSYS